MKKSENLLRVNQFTQELLSPLTQMRIVVESVLHLALKLVNFKSVKVVYLPEGKDANDIGRKEVMKLVWKTRYQDYQDLIKLKNEL